MEIFDDLEAEQDALEAVLAALPEDAWLTESAAPGWTVADTVLHLAQSEEAVAATTGGHGDALTWNRYGDSFGFSRLRRVHAAIAAIAGVPPLVVLPPNLSVIHRVPPVIIVVLPPQAFVVHRVVTVAAKFKTGSTLSATMSGHGGARMSEKEDCDGSHRK